MMNRKTVFALLGSILFGLIITHLIWTYIFSKPDQSYITLDCWNGTNKEWLKENCYFAENWKLYGNLTPTVTIDNNGYYCFGYGSDAWIIPVGTKPITIEELKEHTKQVCCQALENSCENKTETKIISWKCGNKIVNESEAFRLVNEEWVNCKSWEHFNYKKLSCTECRNSLSLEEMI